MAKVNHTTIVYETLKQDDFKKISIYRVENMQKKYVDYINNIDYYCFMLELLSIKQNKDGSIPKNLNRAFVIVGGELDEKFLKDYGRNAYIYTADDGKKYRFYLKWNNTYFSKGVEISCLPCDENGYTWGLCYNYSICLDKEIKSPQQFKWICVDEIEKQKNYQKQYIKNLKDISKVARQLEKVNFYGLYHIECADLLKQKGVGTWTLKLLNNNTLKN